MLIFEDVSDLRSIAHIIPSGGVSHIIVLSNDFAWRSVGRAIPILPWKDDLGADFLIARTGAEECEHEAAKTLSATLGGLPLAHEQAAAYCEIMGTSFVEYLRLFENLSVGLLADERFAPPDYGRTITKTISLSLTAAVQLSGSATIVAICVALAGANPVPMDLFNDEIFLNNPHSRKNWSRNSGVEAIAALRKVGLLEVDEIRDPQEFGVRTPCLIMHKLVKKVVLAAESSQLTGALSHFLFSLQTAFPDEFTSIAAEIRARCLVWLAHDLIHGEIKSEAITTRIKYLLLNKMGAYFEHTGVDYESARNCYNYAMVLSVSLNGENLETAARASDVARMELKRGNISVAVIFYELCLKTYLRHYNLSVQDLYEADLKHERFKDITPNIIYMIVIAFSNVATSKLYAHEYNESQRILLTCISLLVQYNFNKDILTSNIYMDLALNFHQQGNSDEFLKNSHAALELRRQIGVTDDGTTNILTSLAIFYLEHNDFSNALLFADEALSVRSSIFGARHRKTAESADLKIQILILNGNKIELAQTLSTTITEFEKGGRWHYERIASYLDLLASIHASFRNYSYAIECLERSIHTKRLAYGENDPRTVVSQELLEKVIQRRDTGDAT